MNEEQYNYTIKKWSQDEYEPPSGAYDCQNKTWQERLADYYFPCDNTSENWIVHQQLRTPSSEHLKLVTANAKEFASDRTTCMTYPYISPNAYRYHTPNPTPTDPNQKYYSCLGQEKDHEVDLTPGGRDGCGWPRGIPDFWTGWNVKPVARIPQKNSDFTTGNTETMYATASCINTPENKSTSIPKGTTILT
jgi:hypothetical protein